jgi:hypothetical protein
MFDYPVILTPDDGTVLVTFPDVPEAITFGADTDEALMYAVDALGNPRCPSTSMTASPCRSRANQARAEDGESFARWNAPSWGSIRP